MSADLPTVTPGDAVRHASRVVRQHRASLAGEAEFWRAVAREYPEATTGDLAPDAAHAFAVATTAAVRAWLAANAPELLP